MMWVWGYSNVWPLAARGYGATAARLEKVGGGLFGYPVRRRSQSSWSSTSCCHHPGAGPSELSTPSGPTQPHWGQSGLPALGLTPMARAAGRNRTQTLAVMSPTPQPLGHSSKLVGLIFYLSVGSSIHFPSSPD